MNNFDTIPYKRSRKAYITQCTIEYFIAILVSDAFLAKLLTYLGFSDSLTGIISSFISLAFLFQLFAILLVKRIRNTKKTVILVHVTSQLLFMVIYFVPFLSVARGIKTAIVVTSVLSAYMLMYLVSGVYFKWANSFVSPTKRGIYSAVKEMISLLTGIIFTLVVGWVMDRYEANGNIEGSFVFIAVTMFVLNVINFISLCLITKDKTDNAQDKDSHTFQSVVKSTLKNKDFVSIIILGAIWDVGRYASVGFMGTFKTNDLLITVGTVQVINMAANLARVFVSIPFGRFSDKTSYATGARIAMFIVAVGFGINAFTTKSSWWCVVAFTILYNVGLAGLNQNMLNISYSYVTKEYIVEAMAIKSAIGGLLGFVATLLSSRLLASIQENGNVFFGLHVYGQQVLSAISFIILLSGVIFAKRAIGNKKVLVQ